MELSTAELLLVRNSLRFYFNSDDIRYCSKEVSDLITKICVHLDHYNK